jgi:uncharacterized membrane-anchored protein
MSTRKRRDASLAEQLAAGAKKHFSTASSLAFAGATYTPSQVEAKLTELATMRKGVDDTRAALKRKLAEEAARAPPLRSHMASFVAFVRATVGGAPDVLADFGLQPNKVRASPTLDQKAAAVAKREATRAARHTMGTKQKKAVKGTITTIVTAADSAAAGPVTPAAAGPSQAASPAITPHAS